MLLPENGKKIEEYFKDCEKKRLYEMVFDKEKANKVTKNEFKNAISLLSARNIPGGEIKKLLGEETVCRFGNLFQALNLGE